MVSLLLLLNTVPGAAGGGSGKVLVLDMGGSGVAPELARSLSEVLVSAVRDQLGGHASVMSQEEVKSMLRVEQQKELLGCDDTTCYAELAGGLGAERLVAGSLGKVGALYVVTIRLINTFEAKVEGSVSDRVEGKEDVLVEAVSQLTRALFDPMRPYGLGYIGLREEGTLSIDGKSPQRAPFDRLAVAQGTHEFELAARDGGTLWKQAVEIPPYQLTLLQAPVGPAWYTRWWVWTGAAVLVGGGVAGYVLTRPGPGPASGTVNVGLHP